MSRSPKQNRRRKPRSDEGRQGETSPPFRLSRRSGLILAAVVGLAVGSVIAGQFAPAEPPSPVTDLGASTASAAAVNASGQTSSPTLSVAESEAATDGSAGEAAPLRVQDVIDASHIDPGKSELVGTELIQELESGEHAVFTLLPELQAAAEEALTKRPMPYGAVAAIDPKTGAVLALASHHSAPPGPTPLALAATQPAASIFKVITAAALVEGEGVPASHVECVRGGRRGIDREVLRPDKKRDTLCVSLGEALARSTNTAFARLADRNLDRAELSEWAQRFGFARPIPFLWPIEPSKADFPDTRVERAAAAAGFHHTTMSPLHAALIAATIANGGATPEPQIVSRVEVDGLTTYRMAPRPLWRAVSPATADAVTGMMELTTSKGTAAKYRKRASSAVRSMRIAAKTGSLSSKCVDGKRRHNSWLVAFAPADDPQIALATLVVNDPKWHVKAPQVAFEVLDAYFAMK